VIHRDIKAANVLLDSQGHATLVDFGIGDSTGPGATVVGGGSPNSSSPQQLSGLPPQPADDIYSFGVLIMELLRDGPPTSGSPALLDKMQSLATTMIHPEPAGRPESMVVVRKALREIAQDAADDETQAPTLVRPPLKLTPPPRMRTEQFNPTPPIEAAAGRGQGNPSSGVLTAIVFTILILAVAGVFIFLPRWVDHRQASKAAQSAGEVVVGPAAPPVDPGPTPSQAGPATVEPALVQVPEVEHREVERPDTKSEETSVRETSTRIVTSSARSAAPVSEFSRLMSDGLDALDGQDYATAAASFRKAKELDPGALQATRGLERARAGARVQKIAAHRSQGEQKERLEDWLGAVREYETVLALDPAIRFAQIGLGRARDRASLDEQLEFHLANPARLASAEVHANASESLTEARAIDTPGARLADQITRLSKQLRVAETPITVWLESDNLTAVVVFRVGDLGQFQRRSLDLRPGIYTVVGTRDGYRDVRLRLEVVPAKITSPLSVRCQEVI
jgi:tetratricopeptide (TPR) repeat protein